MRQPSLWARIFLLATPFLYESAEPSPTSIAASIEALNEPQRSLFSAPGFTSSLSQLHHAPGDFSFVIRYRDRLGGFQSVGLATLHGKIVRDEAQGTTIIEGTIRADKDPLIFAGSITIICMLVGAINTGFGIELILLVVWVNALIQLAIRVNHGRSKSQ